MLNKSMFSLIKKCGFRNNTCSLIRQCIDEYINTTTSNCELKHCNEKDKLY